MSDQAEITRLKNEIERLQAQLQAQQMPLRSDTTSLIDDSQLLNNFELISDLARWAEGGIVTEQAIRRKWRALITDEMWDTLGSNDRFVEAIALERTRRTRSGARAREQAQQIFEKCPPALEKILDDEDANPRHVVEASRELRAIAAVGPEAQPAGEIFRITINLTGDAKLKGIEPDPHDIIEYETTLPKQLEKENDQ